MRAREAAPQAAGERLLYLRRSPGGLEATPPARDGSGPRVQLLWAAVALLLEAIADDAPGDPAARVAELADLLADVKSPAPPAAEPPWPGEPLTESETRVLRYLPTHLGAPEIAAELYLSANTVKTHLRHVYRKLGAHSRREAVQRARAIGLLAGPAGRAGFLEGATTGRSDKRT